MQQASEVKVGIFVVAVAVLAVFIATSLKGGIRGATRAYDFEIWFDQAPSIGRGSPIRLAGVDIGEVVDKDIITVVETTGVQGAAASAAQPYERVVEWAAGTGSKQDSATVEVSREPLSQEQKDSSEVFRRDRSVARLRVRVRRQYELFCYYRFEIVGGLVFGDRQLNVSDVGRDGLPMSPEARGESIRQRRRDGWRVAVLGKGPANLDAIVNNVQRTLDDDTVARAKAIVRNVQDTSESAKALVRTLRDTVEANRGNADRTMGNVARATEDAAKVMEQARIHAKSILQNVERLTAVGKRVAEQNEGKFHRIVGNVEGTTAALQRMTRNNEAKVDRAIGDVAAIAHDVRGMVASNRDNLDNIAAKLSAASDDVKAITGQSRQQLQSILTKVDDSVGRVRDLLARSDAKLQGIIDDTRAVMGDARTTMGAVRESVVPLTGNLREAGEHLNTASRNVAGMTGDPATRQILANVERATAEARELLADLRSLTGDPKLQEDLRATTRHVRSVSEKLDHTFGGVTSLQPSGFVDAYYGTRRGLWHADVNGSLRTGKRTSLHFGLDDVTHRSVVNAQLGRSLFGSDLRVRYGFYRGRLGLGADYTVDPRMRFRADVYGFEHTRFNLKFTYRTPFGASGLVGVDDLTRRPDWLFGLQLGREWR